MNIDLVALLGLIGLGGLFLVVLMTGALDTQRQSRGADAHAPASSGIPAQPRITREVVRERIRRFGIMTIPFGVFNLLLAGFSDLYGVILIVVGGLSFYFTDDPSILILYAVVMLFSSISMLWSLIYLDLLASQPGWIIYLLVLAGIAGYVLYHAQIARNSLRGAGSAQSAPGSGRAQRWFPWLGTGLSIFSVLGYAIAYLAFLDQISLHTALTASGSIYAALELATRYMAVIGLGVSLAALVARYPARIPAWIGLAGCALRLAVWVVSISAALISQGSALT